MAGMDWSKARKFKAREEKYAPGKVLDNGRMISATPRDSLEARARKAEKIWEGEQTKKAEKQQAFFKKRSKANGEHLRKQRPLAR